MDVTIEFVEGPFQAVVTTVGVGTVAELEAADRVLYSDPRWRPGINVLYDHSELVPSGQATGSDIRALAERDSLPTAHRLVGHVAVVAASDNVYGLARMWLAQLEPTIAERTTVVRTVDDAYAWLADATAE
ncbi:MAG TPA: hypothetical protein VKT18_01920 [Acidimicrobiales bacterium]|nr:hypothetical protein [Acidimicrobiales bacterium]